MGKWRPPEIPYGENGLWGNAPRRTWRKIFLAIRKRLVKVCNYENIKINSGVYGRDRTQGRKGEKPAQGAVIGTGPRQRYGPLEQTRRAQGGKGHSGGLAKYAVGKMPCGEKDGGENGRPPGMPCGETASDREKSGTKSGTKTMFAKLAKPQPVANKHFRAISAVVAQQLYTLLCNGGKIGFSSNICWVIRLEYALDTLFSLKKVAPNGTNLSR